MQAPGESETIGWHYVEAGKGEPVVLLHSIPDSWYLWHIKSLHFRRLTVQLQ
jgi:pimeloyl-ACP methyl ester carboxylesterase